MANVKVRTDQNVEQRSGRGGGYERRNSIQGCKRCHRHNPPLHSSHQTRRNGSSGREARSKLDDTYREVFLTQSYWPSSNPPLIWPISSIGTAVHTAIRTAQPANLPSARKTASERGRRIGRMLKKHGRKTRIRTGCSGAGGSGASSEGLTSANAKARPSSVASMEGIGSSVILRDPFEHDDLLLRCRLRRLKRQMQIQRQTKGQAYRRTRQGCAGSVGGDQS
jgi:hypothetical protein